MPTPPSNQRCRMVDWRTIANDLKLSGKNRHGPLPLTAKTGLTLSIMTISYAWAVSQFHGFALSAVSALSGPLGAIFNIISCSLCQFAVLFKITPDIQ